MEEKGMGKKRKKRKVRKKVGHTDGDKEGES